MITGLKEVSKEVTTINITNVIPDETYKFQVSVVGNDFYKTLKVPDPDDMHEPPGINIRDQFRVDIHRVSCLIPTSPGVFHHILQSYLLENQSVIRQCPLGWQIVGPSKIPERISTSTVAQSFLADIPSSTNTVVNPGNKNLIESEPESESETNHSFNDPGIIRCRGNDLRRRLQQQQEYAAKMQMQYAEEPDRQVFVTDVNDNPVESKVNHASDDPPKVDSVELTEDKPKATVTTDSETQTGITFMLQRNVVHQGSWKKATKVFAYVRKFIDNLKARTLERKSGQVVKPLVRVVQSNAPLNTPLNEKEMEKGQNLIFALLQRSVMGNDYHKPFKDYPPEHSMLTLKPVRIDGVIRAGAQFRYTNGCSVQEFPVILPTPNKNLFVAHIIHKIIAQAYEEKSFYRPTSHEIFVETKEIVCCPSLLKFVKRVLNGYTACKRKRPPDKPPLNAQNQSADDRKDAEDAETLVRESSG